MFILSNVSLIVKHVNHTRNVNVDVPVTWWYNGLNFCSEYKTIDTSVVGSGMPIQDEVDPVWWVRCPSGLPY